MSNPTELLNCPFCGGDAQTDFIEGESYLIECYACRAETGIKDSEEDAISAWNRRAALASRPAYKVARMNPADAEMLESIKVEFQPLESTVARDYQAMMASRPAEVDDEDLPLPESKFCAWLQHGRVWNAFPHGVGDKARWDRGGYWSAKGFDREPLFTAEQYRQGQRDAVAADRARREKGGA